MIVLLSAEAEIAGTPFSDEEKAWLAAQFTAVNPVPESLKIKAKQLIEGLLRKEEIEPANTDSRNFGNSLEWAGEDAFPNIVELTEQVVTSGRAARGLPALHGMSWVKDRLQLVGCAFVSLILLMLILAGLSFLFASK